MDNTDLRKRDSAGEAAKRASAGPKSKTTERTEKLGRHATHATLPLDHASPRPPVSRSHGTAHLFIPERNCRTNHGGARPQVRDAKREQAQHSTAQAQGDGKEGGNGPGGGKHTRRALDDWSL